VVINRHKAAKAAEREREARNADARTDVRLVDRPTTRICFVKHAAFASRRPKARLVRRRRLPLLVLHRQQRRRRQRSRRRPRRMRTRLTVCARASARCSASCTLSRRKSDNIREPFLFSSYRAVSCHARARDSFCDARPASVCLASSTKAKAAPTPAACSAICSRM
jgi:hypothetical protein